ncbi:hypothetical protein G6O67_003449 [Ophiocordyceps sinensis]|uniref:Uncharacterized protein n=1 Tax=Ophiocordyceps sinensis TaxID=72228 RepID=A0A8H4PW89_9HYPO|nr:hypothetical protein G6O67_003449 [Ophiocordyceps sinensis]
MADRANTPTSPPLPTPPPKTPVPPGRCRWRVYCERVERLPHYLLWSPTARKRNRRLPRSYESPRPRREDLAAGFPQDDVGATAPAMAEVLNKVDDGQMLIRQLVRLLEEEAAAPKPSSSNRGQSTGRTSGTSVGNGATG